MIAYLKALIAHETAHQWIPFLIGSDQNDEPWLDEAFAVYSEVLYHEWEYGKQMKNQYLCFEKSLITFIIFLEEKKVYLAEMFGLWTHGL
jgi:aminopeptidase N